LDSSEAHSKFPDYRKTFELLFQAHFANLCLFARKYIKDLDVAKDIVHNVFADLWEKKGGIDFTKPLKSYLYTAVQNRCLNYIRDNKKFTHDEAQFLHIEDDSRESTSDNLKEEELSERLAAALNLLPEKCREVFMLSRFEELKYKDIAEKLDISVKTVETQITKALKILREELKDYITGFIIIAISWLIR
jgi:RNA polymerase sigma-70 factor, ECF subfamily